MSLESDFVFLMQTIISISISYGLGVVIIQVFMKREKMDASYTTAYIVNGTYILFGLLIGFLFNLFILPIILNIEWYIETAVLIFWYAIRALINIFILMILLKLFYRDNYNHGLFVAIVVKSITTFILLIAYHLLAVLFSVMTGGSMGFLLI
jgi:hypothetical protein